MSYGRSPIAEILPPSSPTAQRAVSPRGWLMLTTAVPGLMRAGLMTE